MKKKLNDYIKFLELLNIEKVMTNTVIAELKAIVESVKENG